MDNSQKGRTRRDLVRAALFTALRDHKTPVTVGELFLITGHSHTMIVSVLKEMRANGDVINSVQPITTFNYSGVQNTHNSMHWALVSQPKASSR